jgi:signal transduction histidine kinase
VLLNLIGNAVRYSPPGTEIRVRASRSGGRLRLVVEDRGMGIDQGELLHIFERFRRGSNTENVAGLGIGLYVSARIVRAHGGRIWAESGGPGQGSRFIFELPLVEAAQAA